MGKKKIEKVAQLYKFYDFCKYNGCEPKTYDDCENCYFREIYNTLATIEAKIQNGTLIELKNRKPLMWGKDGDTIHCQHCGRDLMGVFDGEAEVIQCPKCGGFVDGLVAEDYNEKILKELQNENA